ncbi:MAG: EamA family transporter [Opitutaceae bacterium]|nr:EamA family transporter [Opitutaceae bacterium]
MLLLVIVSLIWAFSFGLIATYLRGVDTAVVSAARLGLALLVFLPLLRWRGLRARTAMALTGIGALQFGVMYLLYIQSFRYLQAHEAALFTITTPIIVTLFADALDRTWRQRALLAAVLAVLGAIPVTWSSKNISVTLTGIALIQLSNAAFGVGQVLYKRLRVANPALRDRDIFALPYAGGFAIALAMIATRDVSLALTATQAWTLVYLGVLASGLGFFLWNVGATQVSAGTLAVMNNAKVPLGVTCSLLFFGGQANIVWLLISLGVMGAAVWLAREDQKTQKTRKTAKT